MLQGRSPSQTLCTRIHSIYSWSQTSRAAKTRSHLHLALTLQYWPPTPGYYWAQQRDPQAPWMALQCSRTISLHSLWMGTRQILCSGCIRCWICRRIISMSVTTWRRVRLRTLFQIAWSRSTIHCTIPWGTVAYVRYGVLGVRFDFLASPYVTSTRSESASMTTDWVQ
jgi:hypothetical protein